LSSGKSFSLYLSNSLRSYHAQVSLSHWSYVMPIESYFIEMWQSLASYDILSYREYCDVCLDWINTPLQLSQHRRLGLDDAVKGFVPGSYWCADSTGLELMNLNQSPHDSITVWMFMTLEP
jgi:hypothetical protein